MDKPDSADSIWEEVRTDVYISSNPNESPHICGRACEYMGVELICPITGRELFYQRGDPRQLSLSGENIQRIVERVVQKTYANPIREQMHEDALVRIREKHYDGCALHALQDMRRDYCAYTESYFPWIWTKRVPQTILSRVTTQLSRLMNSKWLSSHRVNTEQYALSLLYVYMDGVVYRGLTIFAKQYELLSLFPPRRYMDLRCVKLILSQIRTTDSATDITRMCDMLESPL